MTDIPITAPQRYKIDFTDEATGQGLVYKTLIFNLDVEDPLVFGGFQRDVPEEEAFSVTILPKLPDSDQGTCVPRNRLLNDDVLG